MQRNDNIYVNQTVFRRISITTHIITFILYACVVLFTIIGTMGGFYWGVLAVGTLLFAWYYMGEARVSYEYTLEGTHLRVMRTSGFKSRPKVEAFVSLDLSRMQIMAGKGSPRLNKIEEETKQSRPRRVTYDVSRHDPRDPCAVLYAHGMDQGSERWIRLRFQPSPEMIRAIRQLCPGRVYEEDM